MYRCLMLIAAATIPASLLVADTFAQSTYGAAPPADLHPPVKLDAETLRAQLTPGHLGLKPQSNWNAGAVELPGGLSFNRDARGVVMSIDQKNEWGVGVGLNVNSNAGDSNLGNSLGLQPKRTPGLMLQKRF